MRSFSASLALLVAAAALLATRSTQAAPQLPDPVHPAHLIAGTLEAQANAIRAAIPPEPLIADPDEEGLEDDEAEDEVVGGARLERRQFTPLVTADNMHTPVNDLLRQQMGFNTPHLPGMPPLPNSFHAREVFAIYNRHKTTCLAVKPHHKEPKLVTTRCQLHQAFAVNSPLSFHWKPVENNLALLAIVYNGQEMCARHRWKGTYFYPCGPKSTKYSLGATTDKGQFQIRDAGRSSRCMDAEFHHALRMKRCGRLFRDQRWEKFHIAFMH